MVAKSNRQHFLESNEANMKLTKQQIADLTELGKTYYKCRGEKPKSPHYVLNDLIRKCCNEAFPIEHQTTGFDRR